MPRMLAEIAPKIGATFTAEIANLTPATMFIKTDRVLEFGAIVHVSMFGTSFEAEVVYATRHDLPHGVVLSFSVSPELRARIAQVARSVEVLRGPLAEVLAEPSGDMPAISLPLDAFVQQPSSSIDLPILAPAHDADEELNIDAEPTIPPDADQTAPQGSHVDDALADLISISIEDPIEASYPRAVVPPAAPATVATTKTDEIPILESETMPGVNPSKAPDPFALAMSKIDAELDELATPMSLSAPFGMNDQPPVFNTPLAPSAAPRPRMPPPPAKPKPSGLPAPIAASPNGFTGTGSIPPRMPPPPRAPMASSGLPPPTAPRVAPARSSSSLQEVAAVAPPAPRAAPARSSSSLQEVAAVAPPAPRAAPARSISSLQEVAAVAPPAARAAPVPAPARSSSSLQDIAAIAPMLAAGLDDIADPNATPLAPMPPPAFSAPMAPNPVPRPRAAPPPPKAPNPGSNPPAPASAAPAPAAPAPATAAPAPAAATAAPAPVSAAPAPAAAPSPAQRATTTSSSTPSRSPPLNRLDRPLTGTETPVFGLPAMAPAKDLPPMTGAPTPPAGTPVPPQIAQAAREVITPKPANAPASLADLVKSANHAPVPPARSTSNLGEPADLPLLDPDGVTLRFSSKAQYKAQHKANIQHGGIIARSIPITIGTQKFLGIEIPGFDRYTLSARVTFIGEGSVGFVIDSFPIHKAQLKTFADG